MSRKSKIPQSLQISYTLSIIRNCSHTVTDSNPCRIKTTIIQCIKLFNANKRYIPDLNYRPQSWLPSYSAVCLSLWSPSAATIYTPLELLLNMKLRPIAAIQLLDALPYMTVFVLQPYNTTLSKAAHSTKMILCFRLPQRRKYFSEK